MNHEFSEPERAKEILLTLYEIKLEFFNMPTRSSYSSIKKKSLT